MKLHLPLRLRSALLAGFASASSFCSIALVPSAAAAAFDFSWDEATHTLTVASSADRGEGDNGILLSTNNSYPGELTSNEHFAAAEKIIFDLSDPGTSAVWFVGAPTVSQAVQIGEGADMSGGLRFYNGSSNSTLTFTGAVTGNGTLSQAGSATNKQIDFTGNVTDFTGTVLMNNSGSGVIRFGSGRAIDYATTATKGVAGTGDFSMSTTGDTLAYNYGGGIEGAPVYVTNAITGANGTLSVEGAADMEFVKSVAVKTLKVGTGDGRQTALYLVPSENMASEGTDLVFRELSFSVLNNAGNGTLNVYDAGGTLNIHSTGSGNTILNGGDFSTLYAEDGTITLVGDINVSSQFRGGNNSAPNVSIGSSEMTATMTVASFYGHWEYASAAANSNRTTITVNRGSLLNVTSFLQIARDGKGILNIEEGGTVIAQKLDMGTAISGWTGTPTNGKQARLNLNGGSLYLGAGGLTQANNAELSPGVVNLNSGVLGGTASWSTTLAASVGSADKTLTVHTGKYDAATKTHSATDGLAITLGKLTGTAGTLVKDGLGTLTVGDGSSLYGLTVKAGFLGVSGASADAFGTLTVTSLTAMTEDGGRFWIDLGADGSSSDKVTANSYGNQRINMALSGTAAGTYTVFDGGTGLTDKDMVHLELYMNRGLSVDESTGVSIENGVVKVTITGTASSEVYTLTWDGTDGESWSNSAVTAWTRDGQTKERFSQGDHVVFDGQGSSLVNIEGIVSPGSISVSGDADYTFSGGSVQGAGILTKRGSGELSLRTDMANWTGAIELIDGTLNIGSDLAAVENGGRITVIGASALGMGGNIARATLLNADLTISVAEGDSFSHTGVISGVNGLTKTGGGVLTLGNNGNTFSGDLTVREGLLKMGSESTSSGGVLGAFNIADGSTRVIQVLDGATLDMNGRVDNRYALTLAGDGVDGRGALVNNGGNAGTGSINFPKLILAADASVGGTGTLCIVGPRYAETTIDLAGNTLTKRGTNTMALVHTTLTAGTFSIQEGTLQFSSTGSDSNASAVDFVVGANGVLDISGRSVTVKTLSGAGGVVKLGDKTLTTGGGIFDGIVSGTGALVLTGAGDGQSSLTLSGSNTLTGGLTVTHENDRILLGTEDKVGVWAGATLGGAGTLVVVNGSLSTAMSNAEGSTARIGVSAGENKTISLGGTSSDMLTFITLGTGSVLSGVTGDIFVGEGGLDGLSLALNTSNMASLPLDQALTGAEGEAKILQSEGARLTITDAARVSLTMDAVVNSLLNKNTYLTLTDGRLVCDDFNNITLTTTGGVSLASYGLRLVGTEGGSLLLTSNPQNLYLVSSDAATTDPHAVNEYNALSSYAGVLVQAGETLRLNLAGALPETAQHAGGMVINNLAGGSEQDASNKARLLVDNTDAAGGNVTVILNNEQLPLAGTSVVDPTPYGGDTSFYGDIHGVNGVTLVKQGVGKLTVNGSVVTDMLRAEEGALVISGAGSDIQHIVLNGTGDAVLQIGGNTTAGDLSEGANGGTLVLADAAVLALTEGGSLAKSGITGNGSLALSGSLTLSGGASINGGIALVLAENGVLDIGSTTANSAADISGSGTLKSSGGILTVNTGTTGDMACFGGALVGTGKLVINGQTGQMLRTGNAGYDLEVHSGSKLTLKGTEVNPGIAYGHVTIADSSTFRIEAVGGAESSANTILNVENMTFGAGSTTEFVYNLNQDVPFEAGLLTAGTITIEDGARFVITNLEENSRMDSSSDLQDVLLMSSTGEIIGLADGDSLNAVLSGLFAVYYKDATLSRDGSDILFNAIVRDDNLFDPAATTSNSMAGAGLLWNARHNLDAASQLRQVMDSVSTMITGDNPDLAGASRALAAVAGSTVNALGTAQRDALRDQMGWIRNRTTLMGVNPAYVNDDLPRFHMWMEGTGSYAKLDTRGDESGYQLTTWGGTVGVDADLSDRLTVGAAFTAGYGDLTAGAADSADGHLDSYYASLFGRYQDRRWAHTLILTGGWNDAKLNRTVNYGEGSYGTQGSTSGWGFGAMYELTYDVYLDENRSSVLQPLFNASVVTTRMDGYEETGAGNAGLNVGRQDWTTGTLALGGRWMGLVGSNIFGRESLAEIRVNAAQDLGDRRGETNVSLLGNPGFAQSVRGAKVGTTALQLGAGLSVPVGTKGTIYVNGNADIRDGSSSVNGSVGYRYDF